jgi:hypothetical protein
MRSKDKVFWKPLMMCWLPRSNQHIINDFQRTSSFDCNTIVTLKPYFFSNDSSGVGCSPKIKGYPGCKELELNATLHYTYNRDNTTIFTASVASPPTPKGWIAWGINLKGFGMI